MGTDRRHRSQTRCTTPALYGQSVGDELKRQMAAQSLTLIEVTRRSGLALNTVRRARDAEGWIDLRTLARLEAAVGAPLLPDWRARHDCDCIVRYDPRR